MQSKNMSHHKFFLSLLVTLLSLHGIHAVEYDVTNSAETTPGGIRFTNEIGLDYSKQTLQTATEFIWRLFQQNSEADRRTTSRISLIIESMEGVAYSSGDIIHFSADYIASYNGDVKTEFTGVIYHEVTHSWQWNGNGQAPVGLVEGIADFVRLKAGYPTGQPGQGNSWDEGYATTARFLDYCNGLKDGFVAELNNKMRNGYSVDYFVELLGKTVDQLWSDYKAMYA